MRLDASTPAKVAPELRADDDAPVLPVVGSVVGSVSGSTLNDRADGSCRGGGGDIGLALKRSTVSPR